MHSVDNHVAAEFPWTAPHQQINNHRNNRSPGYGVVAFRLGPPQPQQSRCGRFARRMLHRKEMSLPDSNSSDAALQSTQSVCMLLLMVHRVIDEQPKGVNFLFKRVALASRDLWICHNKELRTQNSELYYSRIKILGICLFLQSVPANIHANTYTTTLSTLTTMIQWWRWQW